jgi:putative ABC transport system substrate-binding protein
MRRPGALLAALLAAWLLAPSARAETGASQAADAPVAVIFPRVKDPYRAAFLAIVNGSRESLGARADVQEVEPGETARDIAARMVARDAGAVVLLGPWGLRIARELDPAVLRVVGGVLDQPAQFPPGARGLSMLPAPRSLFLKLRDVAPQVKRIWVIHGMDDNDWLVERAARDAAELGFGFNATRRDTLSDGARAYVALSEQLRSPEEALWLPPRSRFVREESVLKKVIETAWENSFVVFASEGDLAQRGVMLGVLPDYAEMGRALGEMVVRAPAGDEAVGLLEALDTAIHLKTANHLGLHLDADDPRFKVVWGR